MAGTSVREAIVAEIVERLKKIAGAPGYHYNVGGRVERFFHKWDGDRHSFDSIVVTPAIVVDEGVERSELGESTDSLDNSLTVGINLFLRGTDGRAADTIDGVDIGRAIQDLKRALFRDPTTGEIPSSPLPKTATRISLEVGRIGAEDRPDADGASMTLTIGYVDRLGDPEAGL